MKSNIQTPPARDLDPIRINAATSARCLRNKRGFATVEIVVAMVILSLSLSALFSTIGESLSNIARAEALVRADMLARSFLGRVGVDIPVRDADVSGLSTDGLRWRLLIEPYELITDAHTPVAIYRVVAQVRSSGDKAQSVTLSTLRLAPKEAQ